MPVKITGGSESDRAVAKRAYDRVLEVLPYDGTVPIAILGFVHALLSPLPRGVEARSTPNGVVIAGTAIWKGPPGRPEYLLYEEIAHHIAGDAGLPHDGNAGIFLQELFAGFVKFSLARRHDPRLANDLTMPEIGISGWQRFYGFGTDLGGLMAGLNVVEPVIDRFLANDAVAPPIRTRGAELKTELRAREWSPPELLDRSLELYPELSHAWNRL